MSVTVSNGQILDNGLPFIAKGINIYAQVLMSVGAATVTQTFPGINFVRINVFDMASDTAAVLAPYVNALTSQGVVVELEDHGLGGVANGTPVLTGTALTAAVKRYTDWAKVFKSNPNVVFGTENEPTGTGQQISNEISAIYNAVRATGNNNLVLMDPSAGTSTTGLIGSTFASMTNVAWDLHYYSNQAGFSSDLSANELALANEVAGAQGIKSANGAIPVIIGEYGPAPGDVTSPGGAQAITAVEASGFGSAAWAWETGNPSPYPGDLVGPPWTGGAATLTSFGQNIAQFLSTGHPAPIAGNPTLYIAPGQSADLTKSLLAQDTPALAGDSLTLTAVGASGALGTVALAGGELNYTAPTSGGADAFTYTVSNQLNETATGSVTVSLNPDLNSSLSLTLTGLGNFVFGGDGNDVISGQTGSDWISLGNGSDSVSLNGSNNTVLLGDGSDVVSIPGSGNTITVGGGDNLISLASTGNSVTVGSGQSTIMTGAGGNAFILNGSSASLVLQGSKNTVTINGGVDQVLDTSSSSDSLFVKIGKAGGSITLDNFSLSNGIVDLDTAIASSLNWTSSAQIDAALASDGGGGSMLDLGTSGYLDLIGVAPAMLHASNFQIG